MNSEMIWFEKNEYIKDQDIHFDTHSAK